MSRGLIEARNPRANLNTMRAFSAVMSRGLIEAYGVLSTIVTTG